MTLSKPDHFLPGIQMHNKSNINNNSNPEHVFIIAEAGVNHNGSLELAKKLIDVAVNAGADAVKFQTFATDSLICRHAQKAQYQLQTTPAEESQYEMLRKLELNEEAHKELISYCREKHIQFLSTPFDHSSIDLLARLGISTFKIPSGEITNLPYLRHIARLASEIILSTGMATLGETEAALEVLQQSGVTKNRITVLHATTEYPCPANEVNLRAMLTLRDAFQVSVGYSDHTLGSEIAVAAVALGACVIEKHITLSRSMDGPDHKASMEPDELVAMVQAIRHVSAALGDGIKKPSASEIKNIPIARKSIVAACEISAGDMFTVENLAVKRPATGLNPMHWDDILGQLATKNYAKDELIQP